MYCLLYILQYIVFKQKTTPLPIDLFPGETSLAPEGAGGNIPPDACATSTSHLDARNPEKPTQRMNKDMFNHLLANINDLMSSHMVCCPRATNYID